MILFNILIGLSVCFSLLSIVIYFNNLIKNNKKIDPMRIIYKGPSYFLLYQIDNEAKEELIYSS